MHTYHALLSLSLQTASSSKLLPTIYQRFLHWVVSIQHYCRLCVKVQSKHRAIDFGEIEIGKRMPVLGNEVTIWSTCRIIFKLTLALNFYDFILTHRVSQIFQVYSNVFYGDFHHYHWWIIYNVTCNGLCSCTQITIISHSNTSWRFIFYVFQTEMLKMAKFWFHF
jgi:hypothetical protein